MTDKSPKVSVLVPIYNVERYIERCAVSLFEQTYDNCEFVFVNDCTKDKSLMLLEGVIGRYPSLSDRIKIINHPVNMGLGAARLTGVKNSDGEYITFVDSDDYVDSCYVEKLMAAMLKEQAHIVLSSYGISAKLLRLTSEWYERQVLSGRISCRIWGGLLKRSIMVEHCIYPIIGVDFAEDFAFMTRYVSEIDNVIILPDTIYHYTDNNTGSYMHNVSEKDVHSLCRALNVVSEHFSKDGNRKFLKMMKYAVLEKAKGIMEKNLGNAESVHCVLSLLRNEDLNFIENLLKISIQKNMITMAKIFSYICYKRL